MNEPNGNRASGASRWALYLFSGIFMVGLWLGFFRIRSALTSDPTEVPGRPKNSDVSPVVVNALPMPEVSTADASGSEEKIGAGLPGSDAPVVDTHYRSDPLRKSLTESQRSYFEAILEKSVVEEENDNVDPRDSATELALRRTLAKRLDRNNFKTPVK